MGLFTRAKAQKPPPPSVLDGLIYNSETAHKYSITDIEAAFFLTFEALLKSRRKSPSAIQVSRMADGALEVRSRRAYLGKVKLQGRRTYMQYMATLYDAEIAEDKTLEEYAALLKYWLKAV